MRSLSLKLVTMGAALALSASAAANARAEEPKPPPPPAPAAPATNLPAPPGDPAKAATLAEAAVRRATQGERRVAIDLFEEAYAASPRREYLKAIAELYDALALGADPRDVRLALLAYERYLREAPDAPDRGVMEARAARLREWKSKVRPEPMPRPPERVPVHVLAYDGTNTYEVQLGSSTCTTPCTIIAPPGVTKLEMKGAGDMTLDVMVPPMPAQIRLQHTESRTYTAGAVMVPVGIVVGAGMWALGFACGNNDGCVIGNFIAWPVLGVTTLVTGAVLLARGKITPASDANRFELVAAGGKPRLWLTAGGTRGLGFEF